MAPRTTDTHTISVRKERDSRGRLGLPTYRLDLPVDSPGALPIAPLRNQARNDKDDIRNSQYLLRPSTFSFYTRIEAAPSGERPQKRDDYKRLLCHCNHATFHIREKMCSSHEKMSPSAGIEPAINGLPDRPVTIIYLESG